MPIYLPRYLASESPKTPAFKRFHPPAAYSSLLGGQSLWEKMACEAKLGRMYVLIIKLFSSNECNSAHSVQSLVADTQACSHLSSLTPKFVANQVSLLSHTHRGRGQPMKVTISRPTEVCNVGSLTC